MPKTYRAVINLDYTGTSNEYQYLVSALIQAGWTYVRNERINPRNDRPNRYLARHFTCDEAGLEHPRPVVTHDSHPGQSGFLERRALSLFGRAPGGPCHG